MSWEYLLSGVVAAGLLASPTYALLKPEKF